MKKLLVATTMLFSLSAIADDNYENKNFYLKLEGGVAKFSQTKIKDINVKLKSKPNAVIGLGFGGYIMDKARADLTVNYSFNPIFKVSKSENIVNVLSNPTYNKKLSKIFEKDIKKIDLVALGASPVLNPLYGAAIKVVLKNLVDGTQPIKNLSKQISDTLNAFALDANAPAANIAAMNNEFATILNNLKNNPATSDIYTILTTDIDKINVKLDLKRKSKVGDAMVSGYINLVEVQNVQLFAGAGIGMGFIQEKASLSTNLVAGDKVIPLGNDSVSSKVAKNFAYSLTLGASTKISDNAHVELSYKYKDLGKSKSMKLAGFELGKNAYKSHSIVAGVRFDL